MPSRPLRCALAGLVVAEMAIAGAAGLAHAHGDYDWIRRGGYKGVDGSGCCGQDDCEAIPATRIERTPEGYRLRDFGMTIPFRQTTPSEDGKFWLCRDQKSMRCFFAPPPGT